MGAFVGVDMSDGIVGKEDPHGLEEIYGEPDGFFWRMCTVNNRQASLAQLCKIAKNEDRASLRRELLAHPNVPDIFKVVWALQWREG